MRGPSKEIFNKKIHKQSKLGCGAPTKRFSTRKSTSKASWGAGPQQRDFQQENPQAKQAGVK
ncbi:hypothetical protein CV015_11840 [Staphylococcus haemolyticus]|nr:hypothetical protein CUZ62_10540 [Staphylococcus haemolyticus]AUV70507.1 hypothetical protein CYD28_10485 [Staphylococcus haemolyticus]PPK16794.1 hypothetical protein CV015_11840 [Staphylococcus haemolyticus]